VWNLAFVAAEVIGVITVHFVFGVGWWQLGASFGAVLVLGGGVLVYGISIATPRASRGYEASLRAHLAARQEVDEPTSPTDGMTTNVTGRAA
jgi:hypothetical protein